jgi:citronellol/citronellal dehydrogenase
MPVPVPLKGKTIVITGASRGIGRAIAHRCARDGANIAILAKTAEPHPKLPGTIYTTAKEVEELGGKALPITCDIRFEDQVKKAIDLVVKTFGGIDILVNNASALGLLPTEVLPLKTYDLVNTINARGTFLCSKYCIPHLAKSTNPHILNISPPLNMKPEYFSPHVGCKFPI